MTIHLLRTPDYELQAFYSVIEFLQSFDGPIQFKGVEAPCIVHTTEDLDTSLEFPEYIGELYPVDWDELFDLCHKFRISHSLPSDDKVVILTGHPNPEHWFSSCDPRGYAFVHTADWPAYVKAPEHYPIAYEILENVLQILMKLDPMDLENHLFHTDPIGCVNDFCQNKQQIILKLRTGDICTTCLDKLRLKEVPHSIVNHVLTIFEGIRSQVLFKQGFNRNLSPDPVCVDNTGNLRIGDKIIRLDYLPKSLFVFFLRHPEGILLNDLENHKDELWEIYRTLRPAAQKNTIVELVRPYNDPRGPGTFSVNKNRLNRGLKEALGEPMANFYYLEGNRGEPFKINLHPNAIALDIRY